MSPAEYKRLLRRRWLERFLAKWFTTRKMAKRIASYMP